MAEDDFRERQNRDFAREIERKERRKLASRRGKQYSIWSELGTFGVVGWSVAVPTLIFTAIGIWLDSRQESGISWTLTFIFIGIVLGSLNAWFWVKRERNTFEEKGPE